MILSKDLEERGKWYCQKGNDRDCIPSSLMRQEEEEEGEEEVEERKNRRKNARKEILNSIEIKIKKEDENQHKGNL